MTWITCPGSTPSAGCARSASWTCGSNGAVGRDLLHALGGEHAGERVLRHADALEHLRLLVVLGGIERALEVVEHRQELGGEPLARAGVQLCLLARDALAVVVEVRRDPAQVVHHLLVLALGVLEPREQLVGVRAGAR